MSKPRFPLSVVREFKYRSVIKATGETIECDDFKTLYKAVLLTLRCEIGDIRTARDCGVYRLYDAQFEFGYMTTYEIKKGYFYTEWNCINDLGVMFVSMYHQSFVRSDDTEWFIGRRLD